MYNLKKTKNSKILGYLGKPYLILLIMAIFYSTAAAQPLNKEELSLVLNLAGKQRMLTQKISKEILLIAKGIDVQKNQAHLKDSAALFDRILQGLLQGDSESGLIKMEDPAVLKQLNKINELWTDFSQIITTVLNGNTSIAVLEKVAEQNMPLFEATNFAVKIYEKGVDSDLKPRYASLLNYVGSQRMLTQKMAKELLFVENGIRPEIHKAYLKKTVFRFEHVLMGLLEGDEELKMFGILESGTVKHLELAKELWFKFKPLLFQHPLSDEDLHHIAEMNLLLLDQMDKAVKMYEASMR